MAMWTPGSGGGGAGAADAATGAESSTDEAVARFDGTGGGQLQNSVLTVTDAGVVAGATQLNVDNVRLDGNTVSATSGDLVLSGAASILPSVKTLWGDSGWGSGGSGNLLGYFLGVDYHALNLGFYAIKRDGGVFSLGGGEDVGYGRAATAVARILAGYSGYGAIRHGREVLARTTDLTLTTAEVGILYTNTGASGQVIFTLPAATLTNNVGAEYFFSVRAAQNIRIVAAGSDIIQLGTAASVGGGRIDSSTVGSQARVTCSATGVWDAFSVGTWAAT